MKLVRIIVASMMAIAAVTTVGIGVSSARHRAPAVIAPTTAFGWNFLIKSQLDTAFCIEVQSGNTEADQVFDSENDVGGGPSTKLLNGREAKFKIAFTVANPKDLVMEVRPSFEHESVLFTN